MASIQTIIMLLAVQDPSYDLKAADDVDSWSCSASYRWNDHHKASVYSLIKARNNEPLVAPLVFDMHLSWSIKPSYASSLSMSWEKLPIETNRVPPPKRLAFGIKSRRWYGGTATLLSKGVPPLKISASKPTVKWLGGINSNWVNITDPNLLAWIPHGTIWKIRRNGGDPDDLTYETTIPLWTDVEAAFVRLKSDLLKLQKNPANKCRTNFRDEDDEVNWVHGAKE